MMMHVDYPGLICKFCGDGQIDRLWHNQEFSIFLCRSCGIKFTHSLIEVKTPEMFFNEKYFEDHYIGKSQIKDKKIFDIILNALNNLKSQKGELLDIGCGAGSFINLADKKGWKVCGADKSDFVVRYINTDLKLTALNIDIENGHLEKESFDVITLLDVAPHLSNPNEVFLKIKSALKKKGIIVIKCLYINSKFIKIVQKAMFFRKDKGAYMFYLPYAFYHFTPMSLGRALEKVGFGIKETICINHDRTDYKFLLKHPRTLYYILLNKIINKMTLPTTHFVIFAEKL